MTLAELIQSHGSEIGVTERRGDLNVALTLVSDDSRHIAPGGLFVAMKGERLDGHDFIRKALDAGASALVVQEGSASAEHLMRQSGGKIPSVPVVYVKDSRRALGLLASRFHGDPSSRLALFGVTGTNGKTTVAYLSKAVLEAAGRTVGLIGTVAYHIGAERLSAPQTTPEAVAFQDLLARMVAARVDSVVMEVSSHALALDRTVGAEFDSAIFTNLTQDHLDFHQDLESYFQAKLKLFAGIGAGGRKTRPKRVIVNRDDPMVERVCAASRVPVWTYSVRGPSDIRADGLSLSLDGIRFMVTTPVGRFEITSRLVGEHNVYNVLAVIGLGLHEGVSAQTIQAGIHAVKNVPGRFERVEAGQNFTVVVDYAHTEDALRRLLAAAESVKTGRLITVFGCGGDRDRGKRPKMGGAAAEKSDVLFLTSDNPRTEDPLAILKEIEGGVTEAIRGGRVRPLRYEVVCDRREAIAAAIREAKPGDTVLIAGKGHEDYQIIGTNRNHFDDREVARDAIRAIG